MKNKYPIAIKLIIAFYALVVLVGVGQIMWAFRYGTDYASPTIDGFYMMCRLVLSVCVIFLFILRRRASLYWVLAAESVANIFVILHYIYSAIWLIFQCENMAEVRGIITYIGVELGWNSILMLISIVILGYVIATFKKNIPNQIK
jgi:hypothetical protein